MELGRTLEPMYPVHLCLLFCWPVSPTIDHFRHRAKVLLVEGKSRSPSMRLAESRCLWFFCRKSSSTEASEHSSLPLGWHFAPRFASSLAVFRWNRVELARSATLLVVRKANVATQMLPLPLGSAALWTKYGHQFGRNTSYFFYMQ